MSFRKQKNEYFDDLVHRVELEDLETGKASMFEGKRQFVIVKGSKSSAHVEAMEAIKKSRRRRGGGDENLTPQEQREVLGKRIADVVVAAYIDIGDEKNPNLIEFSDIDKLSKVERDNYRYELSSLFTDVTDLAVFINAEVVKESNFLISNNQTLSSLYDKDAGTQPQSSETVTSQGSEQAA